MNTDILNKVGKENHFKVPEGYFDQLQSNIMSQLSEGEARPITIKKTHRMMPRIITAAASVCLLVCGITAYYHYDNSQKLAKLQQKEYAEYQQMLSDTENASEYIMMDNADIYSCIAY